MITVKDNILKRHPKLPISALRRMAFEGRIMINGRPVDLGAMMDACQSGDKIEIFRKDKKKKHSSFEIE